MQRAWDSHLKYPKGSNRRGGRPAGRDAASRRAAREAKEAEEEAKRAADRAYADSVRARDMEEAEEDRRVAARLGALLAAAESPCAHLRPLHPDPRRAPTDDASDLKRLGHLVDVCIEIEGQLKAHVKNNVNLTCSRALLNKVSRLSHELVYLYPTAVWADAHFEEQHRRTLLAIAEAGDEASTDARASTRTTEHRKAIRKIGDLLNGMRKKCGKVNDALRECERKLDPSKKGGTPSTARTPAHVSLLGAMHMCTYTHMHTIMCACDPRTLASMQRG